MFHSNSVCVGRHGGGEVSAGKYSPSGRSYQTEAGCGSCSGWRCGDSKSVERVLLSEYCSRFAAI